MQHSYQLPTEIIRLDHLNFYYGSGDHIFYNLNFSFFEGGFYFLTGSSGAGKTTLLKLIYTDILPTDGQMTVFGKNTLSLSEKEKPTFLQKIGIIFQSCRLLPHLSVCENVALSMRLLGNSKKKSTAYAKELLHWVGLGNHIEHFPDQISDGQKQRVSIARAVITRPQLLLADEPTGNVDDETSFKIMGLFEELNKMGTTIIMATHNNQLVNNFPYTEIQIHQGQLHMMNTNHFSQQNYQQRAF